MSNTNDKNIVYKEIFDEAYNYLLSFKEINKSIIEKHFNEWEKTTPHTLRGIMLRMLKTIPNKRGMSKTIGKVENLRPYLKNFVPKQIIKKYDSDWKKLFLTIKDNYTPPGQMVIDNPKSYWVFFCKATLSSSHFLSQFSNIEKFKDFVSPFLRNEYTRASLPLLLEKEVYGLGFALACDFLKEIGYTDFVKPDVHIKLIFYGTGISKSKKDYDVFKSVIKFSKTINEIPYRVDKLFWLVGSGNFYLDNIKINTNRDEFIEEIKSKYGNRLQTQGGDNE